MEIYAVGKQWMWKIQYPEGQREINELQRPHQPAHQGDTGRRNDVIHTFLHPRLAA